MPRAAFAQRTEPPKSDKSRKRQVLDTAQIVLRQGIQKGYPLEDLLAVAGEAIAILTDDPELQNMVRSRCGKVAYRRNKD